MKVFGMGRLVKDLRMAKSINNVSVGSFTVAYNKGGDGEGYFYDCVALGKTAEVIDKYFKKGDRIVIYGDLQTRLWENNEGRKIKTTEILVNGFEFVEPYEKKEQEPEAEKQVSYNDDELPF